MADGCNLHFTSRDLNQAEKSLIRGDEVSESKTASNILNGRIINSADKFIKIINNPKEQRHKITKKLIIFITTPLIKIG